MRLPTIHGLVSSSSSCWLSTTTTTTRRTLSTTTAVFLRAAGGIGGSSSGARRGIRGGGGGTNSRWQQQGLPCCGTSALGSHCGDSSTNNNQQRIMTRRTMTTGSSLLSKFPRKDNVIGKNVEHAMESLVNCSAVCFDVDSTVITEEGIDVLAEYLGQGPEISALTKSAMEGGLKFQDALSQRLELLRPSRSQIEACLQQHPLVLSPGIPQLFEMLRQHKKDVYLVSGGFRIMIEPVAKILHIPNDNIYANTIYFSSTGKYKGFDPNEPTSHDMGKPKALQMILDTTTAKKSEDSRNGNGIVMVGDGVTDMQAKPPAMSFIGYGGVAIRDKVQNDADWYITNFTDLIDVLEISSVSADSNANSSHRKVDEK